MSTEPTFLWHDYETFGVNPRADKPSQFAAIRTNMALEIIEDPVVSFCQPVSDYLPDPEACLLTGITPQQAMSEGISECSFALQIHDEFMQPGTCGVGYNSIRFDDEVTRHLFFRNFLEPYTREYRNGNSRWDLIDVVRLTYATRPDGIEWPRHEDGAPSFRLEDLSAANGLSHDRAHDALFDVHATIELARLIRDRQPRLFDYCFSRRDKKSASAMLDTAAMTPVVHVSSRFPARNGCLAVVAPICQHPINPSAVICIDLAQDPQCLADLEVSDIRDRVFTASRDLPDDVERIAIKAIHINKCPVISPVSILIHCDHQRIGLDLEQCLANHAKLVAINELQARVREVFAEPAVFDNEDVDSSLYDGFPSRQDSSLINQVHRTSPGDLADLQTRFEDRRYGELLFRFRAHHYFHSLSSDEAERWHRQVRDRLCSGQPSRAESFRIKLSALRQAEEVESERTRVIDQVEQYGTDLMRQFVPAEN